MPHTTVCRDTGVLFKTHRAFAKRQSSIPPIITDRNVHHWAHHHPNRGVNLSNLKQLANSYTPPPTSLNACLWNIHSATNKSANYLKLNDSKMEFFVAGSTHSLRLLPPLELTIGTSNIKPSDVIRNLGVSFNSTMSFSNHVNHLRQTINFQIRNLWRIRRFIDIDTSHHVARALITSRLDYCNALFTHLSSKDTTRLQRLQNSAVRAVFAVGRRVEVAPLLNKLH